MISPLLKHLRVLAFLTVLALPASAQPQDPNIAPDGNPVPLSGAEYLIAAGAAFGVKKFLDARRK